MSSFGWLDSDGDERRRMLEVIDAFKTPDTVDDLGIGSIRDNLSDLMFPGTSVLHTRLRYVLFVPWLMQLAADHPNPESQFRNLQLALTDSLEAGMPQDVDRTGIIGLRARNDLKRLPSDIYWSALGAWGIRTRDLSPSSYFDLRRATRQQLTVVPRSDDPESRSVVADDGLDPRLPSRPGPLQRANTSTMRQPENALRFDLTRDEADYLADRICLRQSSSLLAWLILHRPGDVATTRYAWDVANLQDAPEELQKLVEHARRFAIAAEGSALVYNLLVAEASGDDDRKTEYEKAITTWKDEQHKWHKRDLDDFWRTVRAGSRRIDHSRMFLEDWVELSEDPSGPKARRLIRDRELTVKKSRARLSAGNHERLDAWGGASGVGRPTFRWQVARSHLTDLYTARDLT